MPRLEFSYTYLLGPILLAVGCNQPHLPAPVASQDAAPPAVTTMETKRETSTGETSTTPPSLQTRSVEGTEIASSESKPADSISTETPTPETPTNKRHSTTLARNPFQPPTITVRTLAPNQVQATDIRLLGIAKRGDQRFVIVENAGELNKAGVGDLVRDWEVVRIGETQVTLRRGLEELLLTIQ
ncbi:hypothetical protein [Blastopirellula marina]|uniref:Type II secretion system protein GspC N-terminal domain-containing protein n=1 Tax=Blastopirellula marina TaxID=124 RepID=A0A2S8GDH2_9BACT|nr:hypothetical protein [Blastopirellula marina]PQO42512.1 hypothetical protein C5Y93_29755 [Blastopirellula marina]